MIPSVRTVPSTSIAFTAAKAFLTLGIARAALLISSAMLFVGEIWAVHPKSEAGSTVPYFYTRRPCWREVRLYFQPSGRLPVSLDLRTSALSCDVANQHRILEMDTNDDEVQTPLCSHCRCLLNFCLHLTLQLPCCVTTQAA